jgi:hypothetical protein
VAGNDIISQISGQLDHLLAPITLLVDEPDTELVVAELLGALGIDLHTLTGLDITPLHDLATDVVTALTDLNASADQFGDVVPALASIADLIDKIRQLPATLDAASLPAELAALVPDLAISLLGNLVVCWLRDYVPMAFAVAKALGVIAPQPPLCANSISNAAGVDVYQPTGVLALDVGLLIGLIRDPKATVNSVLFGTPNAPSGQAAVDAIVASLGPRLSDLGEQFGWPVQPGTAEPSLWSGWAPQQVQLINQTFGVSFGSDGTDVGLVLTLGADTSSWAMITATAEASYSTLLGRWPADLAISGGPVSAALDSAGAVEIIDGSPVTLSAQLSSPGDGSTPGLLLGPASGTRRQASTATLRGTVTLGAATAAGAPAGSVTASSIAVELDLTGLAFVASLGDGDGFLQDLAKTVLGGPAQVSADVTLGWALGRGVYLRATVNPAAVSQLSLDIPVQLDLGPVTAPQLHLVVKPDNSSGTETLGLDLSVDLGLSLGPLDIGVSHLGLQLGLVPDKHGNLGPADLTLGFRPPAGASLAIDSPLVTGGGFVDFDPARGRYSGGLELAIGDVSLTAIGLITTAVGGGSTGQPPYSLLIIIDAIFPPVELGLGFTLTGVGGLLAYNRTTNVDGLRAGVRTGGLDTVLFPSDPVKQADALISRLDGLFPVARGRLVVGPMVRIEWGTPAALLVADVAVLVELPAPIRVVLLGRLQLGLPDAATASAADIKLDVLGVLDFGVGLLSLDASLYDSRIAGFTVSGDMALRLGWKGQPQFAMSIGGWHPAYSPPPDMPALRRLTIAMSSGDNPVLRMQAYLAVTSNTIQFGALAQLAATVGPVAVSGQLGFDVLVQLDPFGLQADFMASVTLAFDHQTLLGVTLQGTVTGPSPWHITGHASITLLFVTVSASLDITIGAATPAVAPAPVRVLDLVTAALAAPANWTAMPPAGDGIVTLLARPAADQVRAHPLGTLSVAQQVCPLGVHLDQFGSAPITGPSTIAVTNVAVGDVPETAVTPVQGEFAPGQFRVLTQADLLSQPAFAAAQAGVAVPGAQDYDTLAAGDAVALDWTVIVTDPSAPAVLPAGTPAPAPPPDARIAATSPAAASSRYSTGGQAWASAVRHSVLAGSRAQFTDGAVAVAR